MRERAFGLTGLTVSEVGVGVRALGGGYGRTNDSEARRVLERALDLGVRYIDATCPAPDGGAHAESLVGSVVGRSRDSLVLAASLTLFEAGADGCWETSLAREALATRLRRLRTDHVEVLWLRLDAGTAMPSRDEVVELFAPLGEAGLFVVLGISTADPGLAESAISAGWPALCVPFNALDRSLAGVIAQAHDAGVAVAVREPLAAGFLSGKYTEVPRFQSEDPRRLISSQDCADFSRRAQQLRFLCDQGFPTLARACLAYVVAEPGVSTGVVGVRTNAQLEDVVSVASNPLLDPARLGAARRLAPSSLPA